MADEQTQAGQGATPARARRKLADYTPTQQRDMPYERLTALRREAWREHVSKMHGAAEFIAWGQEMARRHGPAVKAHHNAVSWPVAFMVGRFGEDVAQWPEALDEGDVLRLQQWTEAAMYAPGIRPLGRTVTLSNRETLLGLEEFGDTISIVDAEPEPDPAPEGEPSTPGALDALKVVVRRTGAAAVDAAKRGAASSVVMAALIALAARVGAVMSNMSDFMESGIITLVYRTGAGLAKPAALYHALYTAMPGETGGGTEVTGGSYARVNLPPLDANWAAPVSGDGHTENLVAIVFPAPTANWGTIVGWAQHDAAAAGNVYVYGALAVNKTVNNGDAAPSFAIGALDITFA